MGDTIMTYRQSEHDAVGAALAAYEAALDRYDDLSLGGADEWAVQDALTDAENIKELLDATRETHNAQRRELIELPTPPAETAWLRHVKIDWHDD
jgi:hypothetical protein